MKKIGILTFHRAANYGAAFQCYALQQSLLKLGADAEILDYRCPTIEHYYDPKYFDFKNPVKSLGIMLLKGKSKKYNLKMFSRFWDEHFSVSKKAYFPGNINEADGYFDVFIAGSDQIWHPKRTGRDTAYLLPFVKGKSRKYSYAASFGLPEIPAELKNIYEKNLSDFGKISVRESSGKMIVNNLTSVDARTDIDPTLLLERECWTALANAAPEAEPYILIYTLAKPDKLIDNAKEFSQKNGVRIIYICDNPKVKVRYPELDIRSLVSPEEFLTLYKNASCVFTNTFHGTVFSIIFAREFMTENNYIDGKNIRGQELLERFGLSERDFSKGGLEQLDKPIDYDKVNGLLEKARADSLNYLGSIVND